MFEETGDEETSMGPAQHQETVQVNNIVFVVPTDGLPGYDRVRVARGIEGGEGEDRSGGSGGTALVIAVWSVRLCTSAGVISLLTMISFGNHC